MAENIKNWKELWDDNYRGKGATEELSRFTKDLNFGSKKGVTYLPWATVERIFKMQDGTYEIIKTGDSYVECDSYFIGQEIDKLNGIVVEKFNNAFFVNVKVDWKGQTYTERYPLQDSSSSPLTRWTQNDLNKAFQRGKVKAIAIVSGIGYKLYEDGDLQFEDEGINENTLKEKSKVESFKIKKLPTKEPEKVEVKEEKKVEEVKEPVKEIKKVEEEIEKEIRIHADSGEVLDFKEEIKKVEEDVMAGIGDVPRDKMETEIKRVFLSVPAKQVKIQEYMKTKEEEKNVKTIYQLTDEELKEVYKIAI